MAQQFNAFEIFEMARQIERNGARYYRRAAEIVDDSAVRDLLTSLAKMEDDHERTFAWLQEESGSAGESDQMAASYGEAVNYLRGFADGLLFDPAADPAANLRPGASLVDIFRLAISAEKDAIAIYVGIKELVPDPEGKTRIDAIIREEMSHASVLSEHLAALRRAGR